MRLNDGHVTNIIGGKGGHIVIQAGSGVGQKKNGGDSGDGGNIQINGGESVEGDGGTIFLQGGVTSERKAGLIHFFS